MQFLLGIGAFVLACILLRVVLFMILEFMTN